MRRFDTHRFDNINILSQNYLIATAAIIGSRNISSKTDEAICAIY